MCGEIEGGSPDLGSGCVSVRGREREETVISAASLGTVSSQETSDSY